ncbi:MAG: NUDIX domain-containing protein [Calditrichaeota bacterium]|nr:MAG: NUDIX domain-containing protein [Calditrichota bacterium]
MPQIIKKPHKLIKWASKSRWGLGALALILLGSIIGTLFTGDDISEIAKIIALLVIAAVALLILRDPDKKQGQRDAIAELEPKNTLQAAAVCFRIENGTPLYLLIKTRGQRRIFPKGKVKKEELAWLAAEREAKEEAGVSGKINKVCLTKYWHRSPGNVKQYSVAVYLLAVEKLNKPKEKNRSPKWFSFKSAKEALIKNRTKAQSKNLIRVLQVAHSKIMGNN